MYYLLNLFTVKFLLFLSLSIQVSCLKTRRG